MINVLIVDDSMVAREALEHVLRADPSIFVIGKVRDGREALAFLDRQKPDLILMDVNMPGMDGFEATRCILEKMAVPVVIVSSSWDSGDVRKTFQAMEAGAVAALEKPPAATHPKAAALTEDLLRTVRLMAEVPVVRRRNRGTSARESAAPARTARAPVDGNAQVVRILAIGASTGGPPALQSLLQGLPKDFPLPILIVQHIAPGFLQGMADWLTSTTPFPVSIATLGEVVRPARVYLAPDGAHMCVRRDGTIVLRNDPPDSGLRPSVAHLFASVAREFGTQAIAVLLTGMGSDGAQQLLEIREAGGITFAQDKQSSVVYGMPGVAIELGGAIHIGSPSEMSVILKGSIRQGADGVVKCFAVNGGAGHGTES